MKILLLLGLLLAIVASAHAQEPTITLEDEQGMEVFFGDLARNISLSPDGTLLLHDAPDEICVSETESATETCYPKPEGIGVISGTPIQNPFAWSFDSRFVTFTANFYQQLREPDIWVFDTQTGEYTNYTEDGVMRVIGENSEGALLDYLPSFAPNGDIYFIRTIAEDSVSLSAIYRIPAGSDTPELVTGISMLPHLGIYYSPSISPDGENIVLPVLSAQRDDERSGLWVINFESGDATQLATLEDANIGMPPYEGNPRPYIFDNPIWTPDGRGILVSISAILGEASRPNQNYQYIDADGTITPLVDMTEMPMGSASFAEDENGNTPRLAEPRMGAITPDGSKFIYLRSNPRSEEAQLVWLPLPPDGSEPRLIAEVEFERLPYVTNPLMGGQHALIMNVLYTFDIKE